jgi:hypothetical protein
MRKHSVDGHAVELAAMRVHKDYVSSELKKISGYLLRK